MWQIELRLLISLLFDEESIMDYLWEINVMTRVLRSDRGRQKRENK